MADEIANPRIVVSVDVAQALANLRSLGGSSAEQAQKIETALGSAVDNANRRIRALGDAISGSGASRKLEEVARAVESLGGPLALSSTQLDNLRQRVEKLAAAGGTVPASLQGLPGSFAAATQGAATLGAALETQATAKLGAMAASAGPAGEALAALGPVGVAVAAALAVATAAIGGTVAVLTSAATSAVDYGSRITDLAARNGIGVESLQKFDFAAKLVGGSVDGMVRAVKALDQALLSTPEKFQRIGLEASELRRLAPEQQFLEVAKALDKIKDPVERNVLSYQLLGKTAKEVEVMMRAALDGAADRAVKLGLVMNEQTVAALDNVGDAATALQESWGGLWRNIGAAIVASPEVAAAINSIADAIGGVSTDVQAHSGAVTQWFGSVARGVSDAVQVLAELKTVGSAVAESRLLGWLVNLLPPVQAAKIAIAGLEAGLKALHVAAAAVESLELPTPKAGATPAGGEGIHVAGPTAAEEAALTLAVKNNIQALKDRAEVQKEARKIEADYRQALAATGDALSQTIGKIRENANAKRAEIEANDKATSSEKAAMLATVTATEQVLVKNAEMVAKRKSATEATREQAAAEKLNAETLQAGMSPLEATLARIEAKRVAEVAGAQATLTNAQAEGRLTEALRASVGAHVAAANAQAAGAAEYAKAQQAKKDLADANKILDSSEKTYAAAMARTNQSLGAAIAAIEAKRQAELDAARATADGMEDQELANAVLEEAEDKINKANDALVRMAKIQSITKGLQSVGEVAQGTKDILVELGMAADSETAQALGQIADTMDHASKAADAFSKGNYVTAAIEGIKTIISGVKSGISVANIFSESDAERAMRFVGEQWGVELSEGLQEKIEADADKMGDGIAAVYANLGAVFEDAGGVAAFGVERATVATRDLFSMLEQGRLTVGQVGAQLDQVFGEVAAQNISRTTGLASAQLTELVELERRFGTGSQAVQQYLDQQAQAGIASLSQFLQNATVTSQGAATVIGTSLASAFDRMVASGMSAGEALKKLQPDIEAFRRSLEASGLSGGAAFDVLSMKSSLFSSEVTGPGFAAIQGLSGFMVALHNQGLLTADAFYGLTEQIGQTARGLEAQGVSGAQMSAALAPELQRIWELQQRYGFEVDETTAALLRDAIAAGTVGEAHMSAQDKMAAASERTAEAIEFLAEQFGYLKTKIDAIPSSKTTTVTTRFQTEGAPGGGGGRNNPSTNPDGYSVPDELPAMAAGGGIPHTPGGRAIRIAEEEYEWAVPQSKALDFSMATIRDAGALPGGVAVPAAGPSMPSNADVVAELQGLGRQLSTLDLLPSMMARAMRASMQLAQ